MNKRLSGYLKGKKLIPLWVHISMIIMCLAVMIFLTSCRKETIVTDEVITYEVINNTINHTIIKEVFVYENCTDCEVCVECEQCRYTEQYVLSLIRIAKHCERGINLSDCWYLLEDERLDHNKTKHELNNKTMELCYYINSSCYD